MKRLCGTFAISLLLVSAAGAQENGIVTNQHDFGSVSQGQRLVHTFTVRTTPDTSVRIQRVDASEPGISARFKPLIPAGSEGQVTVEWQTAQADGPVEATLLVRTDDPAQPEIPLVMKAVVTPAIEFLPNPVVFLTAYQDERPEERVRIVNHRQTPLRIDSIQFPVDHYDVAVETIEPDRIYEVRIKVRSGVALGRYTEEIVLATSQPENPRLHIGANLFVKPDFYAFPETVNFGTLNVEQLKSHPRLLDLLTQSTIVSNRSGPLEIRSVTSDVPFLAFSRDPQTGSAARFRLDVYPVPAKMQRGKVAGHIRIVTNDPDHPELVIPVRGEVE